MQSCTLTFIGVINNGHVNEPKELQLGDNRKNDIGMERQEMEHVQFVPENLLFSHLKQ